MRQEFFVSSASSFRSFHPAPPHQGYGPPPSLTVSRCACSFPALRNLPKFSRAACFLIEPPFLRDVRRLPFTPHRSPFVQLPAPLSASQPLPCLHVGLRVSVLSPLTFAPTKTILRSCGRTAFFLFLPRLNALDAPRCPSHFLHACPVGKGPSKKITLSSFHLFFRPSSPTTRFRPVFTIDSLPQK